MASAPLGYHALPTAQLAKELGFDLERGLTQAEVQRAREKHGWNELAKPEGKSIFAMIFEQFTDLMVIILLVAAVISFVIALMDDKEEGLVAYVEPFVILLILIANAAVGVWQESNAEAALEALKALQSETAKVLRDGEWSTVAGRDLVPGDIVELSVGSTVPADVRVLKMATPTIKIDQSSFTGENQEVSKFPGEVANDAIIQEKTNICFSSSKVAHGLATGVVVFTGMGTEIGKIQFRVKKAQDEEEDSPLQQRLDEFGTLLAKVIFVICVLVWVMNYRNFFDPAHGSAIRGAIYYFKIAVSLAVAAIPEGLPAVITTCLALGTRRMAKRNAIVRKLRSVETLGCTTIICSDKTGTLTSNEMTVETFLVPGTTLGHFFNFEVTGLGFSPVGDVKAIKPEKQMTPFALCAALCNDSRIVYSGGKYSIHGAPTEAAIRVLVEKIGRSFPDSGLQAPDQNPMDYNNKLTSAYDRMMTLEFTRERKSMSVLCRKKGESFTSLYVKGAPESIVARCNRVQLASGDIVPFTEDAKAMVQSMIMEHSKKALRCLGFAYLPDSPQLRDYSGPTHPSHHLLENYDSFEGLESNMILVGIVGMRDPPRPEVAGSIATCKQAGIKVFMITGDNPETAAAVATSIHIFEAGNINIAMTGKQYENSPKEQLRQKIREADACVFSRVEPGQKCDLVKMLKEEGQIVAMTGDGVNDASALKEAHIGIAMGITGTDVAKSASAMVLADDNFSTIVAAVEEGRAIYNNMKAFIRYLISSNIGEVVSIFLTAMLGVPETFSSVQLLWVNLVTDGPPATALGFNPPDPEIMNQRPRKADEPLINSWIFCRYFVIGCYVGIATVGIFVYWFIAFDGLDGHPLVTYAQLSNWSECQLWTDFKLQNYAGLDLATNPCQYFTAGKARAATLSLTVLVTIEMLNALNALSENCSLLVVRPWVNPWLLLAIAGSMSLHMLILYVPLLAEIFGIVPLTCREWCLVLIFSFPVILIDECLKMVSRRKTSAQQARQVKNE